ncbi:MAG: LegC family aminotransferase [Clostridia bacterium]
MKRAIPLSVPNLKGNELNYVAKAVESEWVSTAGPYVTDFEKSITNYVGTPGAVACQSGTAGLHIALILCGVTTSDMIIVPTLTFIAAVNPVKYIGAEAVFMDCDDSLCMDPDKLERFCREECELHEDTLFHRDTGKRIPAMVVVHVFGNMADMERILSIALQYHVKVVEDATEALGTKYVTGTLAGSFAGTMGTIGVYSFNGNKIITTGGGGMIVSHDESLLAHAKHLTTQAKTNTLNFIHNEVGYNYRLTNLQAALGLAQMEQLEAFVQDKCRNYDHYKRAIQGIDGLNLLDFKDGIRSNHWFYSLYCDKTFKLQRDEVIAYLAELGVQCRPIWGLIHEQKPYKDCLAYRIEKALKYHKHVVNVPCSTNLTDDDVDYVISCIEKAGKR